MEGNNPHQLDPKEIDKALANFFFGCNIPFVIVESPYFKNFVQKLNPLYTPPTRKTLSTTLLDDRFNDFQQSVKDMKLNEAVLLLDGWKNSAANTKNVVGMLKIENKKYVFLKSWNFSNIRETGQSLSVVVNECKAIAMEKYNINIYAVITDNASNMMSMGRLVDIWHATCSSHSANLLSKSMCDRDFSLKVNKLLKEFKNSALESQLVEAGGSRVILIADTRWCSDRDAFRVLLRNLPLMRVIMQNEMQNENAPWISNESRNLLLDQNFEMLLTDHLIMLDAVCELINICQKSDCTLATAVELWFKLNIPANNDVHMRLIEERIYKAINPIGLAANFLNHVYQGRQFSDNERCTNMMNLFLQQILDEEAVEALELYKNRGGKFEILFRRQFECCITFWKTAKLFYPSLSDVALKLQYICASTGQLERLFSEWSYVHNTKRNRLTSFRSSKLVTLYYEMRLNDSAVLEELLDRIGDAEQ